jgi:hypothetical protein
MFVAEKKNLKLDVYYGEYENPNTPSWTGELPGRGEGSRHGDERHVRAGVAGAAGDVRAFLREPVLAGGELFFLLALLELYPGPGRKEGQKLSWCIFSIVLV